jgi:hypothetical protein
MRSKNSSSGETSRSASGARETAILIAAIVDVRRRSLHSAIALTPATGAGSRRPAVGSGHPERWPSATDAQDFVVMDDLFIPLWPPAWVEDYTLSDEQLVAAGEEVKLMSAVRSDQRVLLSVSWPGGRRYLMIDPHGGGAAEAFRAGTTSTDSDFARSIDAMWSQALQLAKQILDGELPALGERPKKRRRWRGRD